RPRQRNYPVLPVAYVVALDVGRARGGEDEAQRGGDQGEHDAHEPHPELGPVAVPFGRELVHQLVEDEAAADRDERDEIRGDYPPTEERRGAVDPAASGYRECEGERGPGDYDVPHLLRREHERVG